MIFDVKFHRYHFVATFPTLEGILSVLPVSFFGVSGYIFNMITYWILGFT